MQLGQQAAAPNFSDQQQQQTDYTSFMNGLGADISASVDQQAYVNTSYQQY